MIKTEGENDRNVAEISPLSFFVVILHRQTTKTIV